MSPAAHKAPNRALLILAAWTVPALLAAFNTYMQNLLQGNPPPWRWIVFNSVDWLIYALLTPFVFRLSRRFPVSRRTIPIHLAGALALCIAWAGLGTILRYALFQNPDLLRSFISWIFTTLPFGVGVYFALVGIEHALFYFAQARERETQAARLATQLAEARLSALRMQFNPHFLFNSLNAITVLVRDQNTDAAARMLELLSDVLRQVLRDEKSHETTLSTELDFLERYLAIEHIRFSDRLKPHIQIEENLKQALVPRFLLQPLVENALRHGIAQRADAGFLEIKAQKENEDLVLTVRDDGPGLTPTHQEGVGLSNTRDRLQALYGDRASLTIANAPHGAGVIATVRLPHHETETH